VDIETSRGRLVIALVGESLREAAILLAVFVPLDAVMQHRAVDTMRAVHAAGGIIVLFVIGVGLEVGARWTR